MHSAQGVSGSPTASGAIANLWNPHSTQRVKVYRVGITQIAAGAATVAVNLRRSSARGTPGSTVTPTIDSHSERGVASPAGMLLDLAAFSVDPTTDGDIGFASRFDTAAASGNVWEIPGGIAVPPGRGLVIFVGAAAPSCSIFYVWSEDGS